MEVQVESTGGLRRDLRVRVPAERVSQAVTERLQRYGSRARLPGFRPGKAPAKVVEQQYGAAARMDAISDLVNQTYPEAVGKAGVNPAGQPRIDITAERPGEPLEYIAHIEVYPEIRLAALDTLAIERPVVEVAEADVDRLVENLRKARREWVTVERAAAPGDSVKVDFLGRLDGEPFAGSEGKDVQFELGAGQFLPDLENGIAGHATGASFTVDVGFPADYRAENLRGRTAQFEVQVKEVREPSLPELDEAFLKTHGVEDGGGIEALRAKCRAALEKERDKAIQTRIKSQALEQLLAMNPLELPAALVEQEIPRLREEAAARMNLPKGDADKRREMLPDALFEQTARRRIALGLLIGEVIKQREIRLESARVDKALDDMAADYEQPEQVKAFYRSRPDLLQGLRAMALEDQVVETLIAGGVRTDKPMALDELLNPQRPVQA